MAMPAPVEPARAAASPRDGRQVGPKMEGQLNDESPKDGNRPYQVKTATLEAGKRYAIDVESDDFDPKLRLSFADDNDEQLAEDDDGGDGTNAYLEFMPQRSGRHRLRVTAVNDSSGSYTMTIRELPPLPAPLRPRPSDASTMTLNHYRGELETSDATITGVHVDDYQFRFEGGKQVFLFLDSSDFDAFLEVRHLNDRGNGAPLAVNDDGGQGRNSALTFTPEEGGDYIVRARSLSQGNTGAYTLRIAQES
ncbi:hypothetical protein AM2010_104 [Pelagerythrobacter marensis]|uniref:Peptidase n=2 Tax=Pelagerythrobacter marensis TaxID=543877 RepID=A0A0G3X6F1_9SPHN|nr:hypothetical protein AM2010_104 [Pelagerythrobacter marensis]